MVAGSGFPFTGGSAAEGHRLQRAAAASRGAALALYVRIAALPSLGQFSRALAEVSALRARPSIRQDANKNTPHIAHSKSRGRVSGRGPEFDPLLFLTHTGAAVPLAPAWQGGGGSTASPDQGR